MPSAKRPVRKISSATKGRVAIPAKAQAGRSASGKAGRKSAPVKAASAKAAPARKAKAKPAASKPAKKPAIKPASKPASKPGTDSRLKITKGGKAATVKLAVAGPAKASAAKVDPGKTTPAKTQSPPLREMVVRSTPGLIKSTGRKPSRLSQDGTRRGPERYDPDALIHGIKPYRAQSGETYMNPTQLEHFRQILLAWRRELMEEVDRTVHHMQDEASNFPDPNDRATQESEFGLELRTRDRERKLLKKIDGALERIGDRAYGYCEETGEEIGLKRLEARPVATLCLEAQERRELAEKQYGEREDQYR